jgi:aspartate dehydrogenase
MHKLRTRVGVVGAGTIGRAIIESLANSDNAVIAFVVDNDEQRKFDLPSIHRDLFHRHIDENLVRNSDLIIEAAHPAILREFAPYALRHADVCGFSCSALSLPDTEKAVMAACAESRNRFFVPHGAAIALDGIRDGRELLTSVSITTTKSGKSLGIDHQAEGCVFEGRAREACQKFPRNANIHAAVSLAGIGFDRTTSRIVAVPGKPDNDHKIIVEGQSFDWSIKFSSTSLGGVTGGYTVISAVNSVKRIVEAKGIVVA